MLRKRDFSFGLEAGFGVFEESLPYAAVFAAVAPVSINTSTGTLAFAGEEEPAPLAASEFLGRVIERDVALEPLLVGLLKVDAFLVG